MMSDVMQIITLVGVLFVAWVVGTISGIQYGRKQERSEGEKTTVYLLPERFKDENGKPVSITFIGGEHDKFTVIDLDVGGHEFKGKSRYLITPELKGK